MECQSANQWGHPFGLSFDVDSPPPLRINLHRDSMSVRIEGQDGVVPWIHASTGCQVPPIKGPPQTLSRKPISFRSRHTGRNRSRALQCNRLVAWEWGSSWAHVQVSDLVYLHFHISWDFIIIILFLSIWLYLIWIYTSCLVKVLFTFVCGFIERLVC